MIRICHKVICAGLFIALLSGIANADHRVLLHGAKRLAIVETDGTVSWEMKWRGVHDIHILENGNILTHQGRAGVAEINPKTKEVVWSYDSSKSNGNEGKQVEVHALERLENGHTMIAESGAGRIIEVDADGKIHKELKLELDHPDAQATPVLFAVHHRAPISSLMKRMAKSASTIGNRARLSGNTKSRCSTKKQKAAMGLRRLAIVCSVQFG